MAERIALLQADHWHGKPFQKIRHMLAAPKIRWRTAFTYALIIVMLMSGLTIYLSAHLSRWYYLQTLQSRQILATRMAADAALVTALVMMTKDQQTNPSPNPSSNRALDAQGLTGILEERSALLGARLTLYDANGATLADSHLKTTAMEILPAIPDQLRSAAQNDALDQFDDDLSGRPVVAFVRPIYTADTVIGYLRLSFPAEEYQVAVRQIRQGIIPIAVMVALCLIGMMIFQAERAAYTLRRLTAAAEQITKGNLSARTLSLSGGEVGQFVRAFNRMADKLQQQIQKRAREKDRLHTVLHVMTDGVLLLNRHNSVRLLNDAAATILQTTPERTLRRSFVQTVRDHRIVEVFRRCQASGKTETAVIERNEDSVLRVVVTPFLRGKDRGHLVVLQDLTRMRQLQTARQDFVSNISHELRTPLASLRALVETLSDGAIDDADASRRFLRHMEIEVDALTQMVQELLELSRIESGKVTLQLAAVETGAFIRQSCERLQAQADRANVTLLVEQTEALPPVQLDISRMQQVITNLLHNAIKFTPAGGTIRVRATADSSRVVTVAVEDTGVGIAYEDLTRIFERFYKADRARTGGGTGLGLAIAKHIVQAHGGKIWAESLPGKGSTFFLTIPIASTEEQPPVNS